MALEKAAAHVQRALDTRGGNGRLLVSIAGGPGAGKSTFAAALSGRLNGNGEDLSVVVGMDGYHKTSEQLEQLVDEQSLAPAANAPRDGSTLVPLRRFKGRMPTFHGKAFLEALYQLQSSLSTVCLPVYDRELHEPRADAVEVGSHHRVVIVEGLFLNITKVDLEGLPEAKLDCCLPWERAASLFPCQLFIDCSKELTRERLLLRKRLSRATSEFEEQWRRVDAVNWGILQRCKERLLGQPLEAQPLFLTATGEGTLPDCCP